MAKSRTTLATSALTCLALAALAGQAGVPAAPRPSTTESVMMAGAGANLGGVLDAFDRRPLAGSDGESATVLDPAAEEARRAEEARAAAEAAAEAERLAANPTPVAGLDQVQMNNALKIVKTGQEMGLPKRAFVIAVATSMQESNLRNLASTRIPESYNYNPEGSGSDHDSVGLFQQRPSSGWGAVSQLMDPKYASGAFYNALVRVPGWDSMALTWAAQRVQVSAFPLAYAKHEPVAQQVVDALVPTP